MIMASDCFFFSSRRRHTRFDCDWSSDVCSSDLIAQIGRLPGTLADRCIVIRMQRKMPNEQCDRVRDLDVAWLKERCAKLVDDNQHRSEERRVGEEGRSRWSPYHLKKKKNK